jgi:hypothetical protein
LNPLAAWSIVIPCGSIAFTFEASWGCDWILVAIGDGGGVVPVVVPPVEPDVDPLVEPDVDPLVEPEVDPLVVPLVVVLVRPLLCDELPECVDVVVLADAVVVLRVVEALPCVVVECDVCASAACVA